MAGRAPQPTARQIRDAEQRIEAFQRRFGEGHLALAYHAAFPAALTPDLLYSLWAVFRHDIYSVSLEVEREAVADLLLSRLCTEVGTELYELDEVVQLQLRNALATRPELGQQRVQELAAFLLEYVRPDLMSDDVTTRELAEAQRFVALAPTNPESALRELVTLFIRVGAEEQEEWIRLARLVEQTTAGQPEFNKIHDYADAMRHYGYGDLEAATQAFMQLTADGLSVPIAGVPLLVPEAIARRLNRGASAPPPAEAATPGEAPPTTGTGPGTEAAGTQAPAPVRAAPISRGGGITRSLAELFVNRLKELERFRKSLEGSSNRRIILVSAGPGMGKSWLLRRFAQEAEARNALYALIDFVSVQLFDTFTLIRSLRDQLGAQHFNRFTAAINDATASRTVLESPGLPETDRFGSHVGDVRIGEIAGQNIIKDNLFLVQTDNPLLLQAIEDRITQIFFEDLTALTTTRPVVLLFDSYEQTSQESERWVSNAVDRWIQRELLLRIRDGRLPNTIVVLAGRRLPAFDAEWARVVGPLPLELFTVNDVAEYLRQNRRLASLTDAEVQTLYNAIQGNPQLMGIVGDNLERSAGAGSDDDDW